jgi:hypothetical protein
VLNFLLKNANIVAMTLCFWTLGLMLGEAAVDLTPDQATVVLIASAACGITILMHLYKTDNSRAKVGADYAV